MASYSTASEPSRSARGPLRLESTKFTTYFVFEIDDDFDGLFQMFYCPVSGDSRTSSEASLESAEHKFNVHQERNCFLMKFKYPGGINTSAMWRGEEVTAKPYSQLTRGGGLFQIDRIWPAQILSREKLNSVGIPWNESEKMELKLPECAVAFFSNPDVTNPHKLATRNDPFLTSLSCIKDIYDYKIKLGIDRHEFMRAI